MTGVAAPLRVEPAAVPTARAALTPRLLDALRLAALPYLVSRAVLFAVAVAANRVLPYGPVPDLARGTPLQGFLGWDATHYLAVARAGYPVRPGAVNDGFFPLLPLLLRLAGASNAAALALGLVLGLAGLAALTALTREVLDAEAARRAAWAAAFWPAAFYWSAVYTEGLFAVLLVGALWTAWRGRPGWAAAFGFLAGLTRPTGAVAALPLLVLLPRGRARWAAAAPVLGLAAFAGYLWLHTGTPLALARGSTGHGNLAPGQPWRVVGTAVLWAQYGDWQQVAELPVIVGVGVLVALLFRLGRWRTPAVVTALALALPPILAGTASSFARYAMVAVPLYWPLRRWPLWAVLAVEVPVCLAWTAFATTGHLTP